MAKTSVKVAARKFAKDERGAAMIEYSVLIGIITAAVIGIVVLVGGWVTGEWEELANAIGVGGGGGGG